MRHIPRKFWVFLFMFSTGFILFSFFISFPSIGQCPDICAQFLMLFRLAQMRHCMKCPNTVISGLYFPVFGLNTEIYFVNRRSTHSEILSMNSIANVFAFGDFDVHHNDSLTYSDGTDRLYLFYRGFLLIRKSWSSFLAQFLLAFLQIQNWCSFLLNRWW